NPPASHPRRNPRHRQESIRLLPHSRSPTPAPAATDLHRTMPASTEPPEGAPRTGPVRMTEAHPLPHKAVASHTQSAPAELPTPAPAAPPPPQSKPSGLSYPSALRIKS